MFSQAYKEYGIAHSDISYVFKQSTTGFSGAIQIGPTGRGSPSNDPSASGRDHFATINQNGITILQPGFYSISAQFLMHLKFNPSNNSSFLFKLSQGSTNSQIQLGYSNFSGGTYSNLENGFLIADYPYLSASPLATQVMTSLFSTTSTFEFRGLCSFHSTKLRLNANDFVGFSRVFNGSTTFDWIMNGGLWVEKLS
jgi:hypothetical protein